jgi:hypothetical protein
MDTVQSKKGKEEKKKGIRHDNDAVIIVLYLLLNMTIIANLLVGLDWIGLVDNLVRNLCPKLARRIMDHRETVCRARTDE